ncbi:MAG: FIG018426: putative septation inhibitor protein, partial [uncultured Nocardioidaceae bacterium]
AQAPQRRPPPHGEVADVAGAHRPRGGPGRGRDRVGRLLRRRRGRRRYAEAGGGPRELELPSRLRRTLPGARPGRPSEHAAGQGPRSRGGDARVLPARPAVDRRLLRDRPDDRHPDHQCTRQLQPAGGHRVHVRRLRLRHQVGV